MTRHRIREIRAKCAKMPVLDAAIVEECLLEIEHYQGNIRRGEEYLIPPEAVEEPEDEEPEKPKETAPSKLFIDQWYDEYQQHFKEKYMVQGGKDATAAKRLTSQFTVDELMWAARKAWQNLSGFNCKQAVTISGFASRYNDIKIELKAMNWSRQIAEPARCNL